MPESKTPVVGLIMGSKSDWPTMQYAAEMLDKLGVSYEKRVVSAHRTPDLLFQYAEQAADRGLKTIIAGAGGQHTCQAWWQRKPICPYWAFPCNPKH